MKRLMYLIGIILLASACKEVYEAPPLSLMEVAFYESTTDKSISPLTTVQGVGANSLWFGDTAVSRLLLPLKVKETNGLPIIDTTSFIIWLDSWSDSLIFIHETTQKYVSMESGFYYEYKLLSVSFTQNRIDSVRITDSLVTKKWNENIKLYIHPLPAGDN